MIKGYPTPCYLTYKQAQKLGGIIKKGEKGNRIIYWAEVELIINQPMQISNLFICFNRLKLLLLKNLRKPIKTNS